jgi:hypothetical protein
LLIVKYKPGEKRIEINSEGKKKYDENRDKRISPCRGGSIT